MRKSIAKILTAVTIISILSGDTLPVFASDADGVAQESQSATEFHFEEEVTSAARRLSRMPFWYSLLRRAVFGVSEMPAVSAITFRAIII